MGYHVEIADVHRAYLDGLRVSTEAKARLLNLLLATLEEIDDTVRMPSPIQLALSQAVPP